MGSHTEGYRCMTHSTHGSRSPSAHSEIPLNVCEINDALPDRPRQGQERRARATTKGRKRENVVIVRRLALVRATANSLQLRRAVNLPAC